MRVCWSGKTVLLPHLGSATLETRQAMGFRVIENLDDFSKDESPEIALFSVSALAFNLYSLFGILR